MACRNGRTELVSVGGARHEPVVLVAAGPGTRRAAFGSGFGRRLDSAGRGDARRRPPRRGELVTVVVVGDASFHATTRTRRHPKAAAVVPRVLATVTLNASH